MEEAERIAREEHGAHKLAVISGSWADIFWIRMYPVLTMIFCVVNFIAVLLYYMPNIVSHLEVI